MNDLQQFLQDRFIMFLVKKRAGIFVGPSRFSMGTDQSSAVEVTGHLEVLNSPEPTGHGLALVALAGGETMSSPSGSGEASNMKRCISSPTRQRR